MPKKPEVFFNMITKNTQLKEILAIGNECDQCGHCCSYGSGILIGDDLKNISHFLGLTKDELKKRYLEETERFNTKLLRPKLLKKPYGPCVFLDKKTCRINDIKPLQCRIGNCGQHGEELSLWFMLNYLVNTNDPESIRQFASYLKTGGKTLPGGQLNELIPDKGKLDKMLRHELR